jgi:hypothetical protein
LFSQWLTISLLQVADQQLGGRSGNAEERDGNQRMEDSGSVIAIMLM